MLENQEETNKTLTYIDLFAGCGGMGLGLKSVGFKLFFANELSPMAGETFAYNFLQEDLDQLSKDKSQAEKTLWIKSQYEKTNLKARLRENPFEAAKGTFSDLTGDINIEEKLLIGDINNLLDWLNNNPELAEKIRQKNITLVSGGPPCQSFSMAGKREKNNAKNLLPLSFAKFVGLVQPKFVLLENVKGITAPFTENETKYYAWFEVAKAFALEGYMPVCMLLNSKYFGVAQNRPRYIMLGLRIDIATALLAKAQNSFLLESLNFYQEVQSKRDALDTVRINSLHYYDIEDSAELYNGFIFPKITTPAGEFVSASEAIGDLKKIGQPAFSKSRVVYRDYINNTFKSLPHLNGHHLENHEPRGHGFDVRARFRLYQIINEFQNGNKKSAADIIVGKEVGEEHKSQLLKELTKYNLYVKNERLEGEYKRITSEKEVETYINSIVTKKHSQRALREDEPAPAQLTIPDDICHYDMSQLRTLTVREMARFQSFPDWFTFRSKVTTGGDNRKFETPQYTQVGNAVPPLLAKALGEVILTIISNIESSTEEPIVS